LRIFIAVRIFFDIHGSAIEKYSWGDSQVKAIVTGCAGFIGSHLCEELLAAGHSVVGIDNLVSGRKENLAQVQSHPNFHFVLADIFDLDERPFEEGSVVFHLAALADIIPSVKSPERYHNTNVTGTLKVLEAARRSHAQKFVYAASSSCYGLQGRFPINEKYSCTPMYPYALTKYVGEQYVKHWGLVYKIPTVSLRLFNVYGPRHRTSGSYGAVFGTWLAQMANGHPITIVGDGAQSRDFVYVKDVAKAFLAAAEAGGGVYNVGSGETFTISELADLLGAKDRVYIPRRPGEPDCTWAKIGMARRFLNWKPRTEIWDGVNTLKANLADYKSAPLWTPEKINEATKDWMRCLS
jgi:UDP-glucose 4-epimerase